MDVQKSSSASGTVNPGDTITYMINITNTSGTTQNNIVVVDPLPVGTTYVTQSTNVIAPVAATPSTYLDQFSVASYTNSNGTATWSTSWTEGGEEAVDNPGNSPSGGYIQIAGGELSMDPNGAGSYGGGAITVERSANLAGVSSATLSFTYDEDGTLKLLTR